MMKLPEKPAFSLKGGNLAELNPRVRRLFGAWLELTNIPVLELDHNHRITNKSEEE